jgi:hypothetical protein
MTFPVQPSFGLIEKNHLKCDEMAADIEAIAQALLGTDTPQINGGAIIGDQAVLAGSYYTAAALGGNRTLTLPVAVTANGRIMILRSDVTATTLALGAVFTMPASKAGLAVLRADGANWILEHLVLDGKMVYTTVGHCKIVAPAAGATVTLAGNLTTTGGNATVTVPAAGGTITLAGNLTTTGAYNTTIAQAASTTVTLPAVSCTLAPGTALAPVVACPAHAGNDFIPLDIENGKTYVLGGATAAASTITLPAAAANGTRAYWFIDGVLNGHTVQFRDATGPKVLTAALAASKRILAMVVKLDGKWAISYSIEP